MKIDHIGIAIENIDAANDVFSKLIGNTHYKIEDVISEKVGTTFYDLNNTKIELVNATSEESVIHKFIQKKGNALHHIALEVEDIYQEIERLQQLGFEFINDTPKDGADNKLICFLHPKTTQGILIELCQTKK